jgi:hypothetical protein
LQITFSHILQQYIELLTNLAQTWFCCLLKQKAPFEFDLKKKKTKEKKKN